MKICVVSDLHLDTLDKAAYYILKQSLPEADLLLVAGDIGVMSGVSGKSRALSFFEENAHKYKHILYVAGNHDAWGSSLLSTRNVLKDFTRYVRNFTLLTNEDEFSFEGTKFVGDTLWFKEEDTSLFRYWKEYWIDFDRIVCATNDFQKAQDAFLAAKIIGKDLSNTIVMTHHMPSYKCVAPEWEGNESNIFFANELDDLILATKPKMWIFGHTHNPFDFKIGDTRLFSNPGGYPGEGRNYDFIERSLIQL